MRLAFAILALSVLAAPARADRDLSYVAQVPAGEVVVIDSRGGDACATASLPGARCLGPDRVLGPHGRLAGFSGMAWLLGTLGLTGDEHAVVVGTGAVDRDFVAGLLYILGQRRVSVLTRPVAAEKLTDPGTEPAIARTAVYAAPARDGALVLTRELAAWLRGAAPPVVLDGRGEDAYWGRVVRGVRGGHLPGAQPLPAARLRADLAAGRTGGRAGGPAPGRSVVAYGHDPRQGIAYMTLLRAGLGLDARAYAGGWAAWAADGSLPADAATHPDRAARAAPPAAAPGGVRLDALLLAVLGAALAAALAVSFHLGRRRERATWT